MRIPRSVGSQGIPLIADGPQTADLERHRRVPPSQALRSRQIAQGVSLPDLRTPRAVEQAEVAPSLHPLDPWVRELAPDGGANVRAIRDHVFGFEAPQRDTLDHRVREKILRSRRGVCRARAASGCQPGSEEVSVPEHRASRAALRASQRGNQDPGLARLERVLRRRRAAQNQHRTQHRSPEAGLPTPSCDPEVSLLVRSHVSHPACDLTKKSIPGFGRARFLP